MFVTSSPFFDIDGIAKVSLTQQESRSLHKEPTLPNPEINETIPTTVTLKQNTSSNNPIKDFITNQLFGQNNEYSWFWFIVAFLFCVTILGINIHLVNKLDSLKTTQDSLMFFIRSKS